jgi:hypothetical protein
MDEQRIEVLQKFEKPNTDFLKDKECLICLEPVDLEMNQIVMLPCKCANSAYHIPCIIKLLQSGENKNFCPHCKKKYQITFEHVNTAQNNYLLRIEENRINDLRMSNYVKIVVFHLVSNSIMNLVGISLTMGYSEYNSYSELNMLLIFYFFKLFLNCGLSIYSSRNIDKIENALVCSYFYNAVSFVFLIYFSSKNKNKYFFIFFILNYVLFGGLDLAFRYIIEYKARNRVVGVN